jgi:hypothetical protein
LVNWSILFIPLLTGHWFLAELIEEFGAKEKGKQQASTSRTHATATGSNSIAAAGTCTS